MAGGWDYITEENAEDIAALKTLGVKELFTPGTSTQDIVRFVRQHVRAAV